MGCLQRMKWTSIQNHVGLPGLSLLEKRGRAAAAPPNLVHDGGLLGGHHDPY